MTAAGRTVVVANPAAACVDAALVAEVVRRLGASDPGPAPEVRWTTATGDAQRHAGALGPDVGLVVAVGGDGTAREVAAGLHRRQPTPGPHGPGPVLLVLPAGSGNSTARNLWGERTWTAVLDEVATPGRVRVRRIDLLRLVEWDLVAVLGASSGFLAQVLVDARTVTGLSGLDRYLAAAAEVLADMPDHPTRVVVDGRVVHDGPTSLAAVGGGRFRAGAFQFLPAAELDDGLLHVCVIDAVRGSDLDEIAAAVPSGAHVTHPRVHVLHGRRVVIERTDGAALVAECDGDVHGDPGGRLTVEVLPGALAVVAPVVAPAG
jgi:diacylglycerol kinase (ATP)